MTQPHPSLLLVLDIDESLATRETRAEVRRCYGYVGSTVIRTHETAADGDVANTVEMHVKLAGERYLREQTAEADDLWSRSVERWLFNQFHTVGNQMMIYNRRQREEGNAELYFDWLVVHFEEGAFKVHVKLDSVSSLPPECSKVIAKIRQALNDGSIEAHVTDVYIPSPASFAAQARAWELAEPEREATRLEAERAEAAKAEAAKTAAAAAAAENFAEAPDLVAGDEAAADEESWQEELRRRYALPSPDFEIDYTTWGIVETDGRIRSFDSEKHCYMDAAKSEGSFAAAENA